ncbi:hypothetical protein HY045_00800 [Candidatus Woesebacteria bacterium]|nr:hypothetical protein [Candidatus Woesebacteria bacterium]
MFKDLEVEIDSTLATILLTGILSDTNFFQNFTSARVLSLVSELVNKGADHNFISFNMLRRNKPDTLKIWGALLSSLQVDYDHKFVWLSIPYEEFKKYNIVVSSMSEASDLFAKTIDGTNFGIVMVEKEKNKLHISLRSRENWFDVSRIAYEFGGGGHKLSSGGAIKDMAYDDAVKMVLSAAVKHYDQKIS